MVVQLGVSSMVVNSCSELFQNVADTVQSAAVWLTHGPKLVFSDINATGDLLRLTQNAQKVADTFARIIPLDLIADGVSSVVEFLNARDIVGCVHDLVSGEAAKENPISPGVPNFLNVAQKLCTLIQDVTSFIGWLVSVKILDEWVTKCTATIVSWGKAFVVLDGICDVASIAGSLFDIADSARLIAKEAMEGLYWLDGKFVPSKLIDRCLDVAMDICWIASSVLNNIPGMSTVYMYVSSGVGSMISLGKFFKEKYLDPVSLPAAVA
jgi:hypothetical protein